MGTAERAVVRAELAARSEQLSATIVAEVVAQIPAYAALSGAQLDEVRAIADWGAARVLELWVDDADLGPADLRRFRGIGTVRALDGRPLPAVLRAYRIAGQAVVSEVERVGADRLTTLDVIAIARLWMACIDALSEAIYEGYTSAAARVGADRSQAVAELVDDLLGGRHSARTALADRARELGLHLGDRLALIVVTPREQPDTTADPGLDGAAVSAWLDDAALPAAHTALRVRDGLATVVAPHDAAVEAAEALGRGAGERGWRGVALGDLTAAHLPARHRLAVHALRRAPRRAHAHGRALLDEPDVQTIALLTGHADADAERLAALVLGPLNRHDHDTAIATLEAYLETGAATEAAAVLGLHAQSLRHRLRRLRELTGRDVRRPWDRLVLEVALLADRPRN